ncbi:MAG: polysaccharide deacetylase family protein [Hyphomonadaceae bacterium]|nr:polysaccharide deacetylase family protein [Hyphomonadaceae bacterium]
MRQAVKSLARAAGLERRHIEAARMYAERRALAFAHKRRDREVGRILCYHSVGQPVMGVNDVSPKRFARQIELALELGYHFVAPAEIAAGRGGPKALAVSFDDALKSVLAVAHPVLRAHRIPYSVFIVSEWSDGNHAWEPERFLSWAELETLKADGVELGSHSATHRDFGRIDAAYAKRELEASRAAIEARLGFAPTTFAIPFGQSMNWTPAAHDAARACGYTTIYAQAEDTRPPGTIARTFVTHFDDPMIFRALLGGAFDSWEEWVWSY